MDHFKMYKTLATIITLLASGTMIATCVRAASDGHSHDNFHIHRGVFQIIFYHSSRHTSCIRAHSYPALPNPTNHGPTLPCNIHVVQTCLTSRLLSLYHSLFNV